MDSMMYYWKAVRNKKGHLHRYIPTVGDIQLNSQLAAEASQLGFLYM